MHSISSHQQSHARAQKSLQPQHRQHRPPPSPPNPALRGIVKHLIIQLDAPQELEPSARQHFIHNSNRELRARHRAIQTRASLEHARAAIDDLVEPDANNDESLETVHVIYTVDNKPRF